MFYYLFELLPSDTQRIMQKYHHAKLSTCLQPFVFQVKTKKASVSSPSLLVGVSWSLGPPPPPPPSPPCSPATVSPPAPPAVSLPVVHQPQALHPASHCSSRKCSKFWLSYQPEKHFIWVTSVWVCWSISAGGWQFMNHVMVLLLV